MHTNLFCYLSRAVAPSDWRDACLRADLMFSADDSDLSESSRPEVGNGNIATVVGKAGAISNPHIFVAGLFNGCGQKGCHQVPRIFLKMS